MKRKMFLKWLSDEYYFGLTIVSFAKDILENEKPMKKTISKNEKKFRAYLKKHFPDIYYQCVECENLITEYCTIKKAFQESIARGNKNGTEPKK